MQFNGLKIGNDRHSQPDVESADVKATDYLVMDAGVGGDLLDKVRQEKVERADLVVYGEYDDSEKGLGVRINDFLIDHSSISLKDKSYFFHMLAVMVDAGIPVVRAVRSLAKRSTNPRFGRVLNTLASLSENGSTLSDAMMRFDGIFDESEIGIIRSGEATGRLYQMLFKLSSQLDARHDLYLKLWGAAVYPIAVFSVLIVVAVGMLVWVFPTLLNLLAEGGFGMEKLPLATRALILIQDLIVNYWWAIIGGVTLVYALMKLYIASSYGAVRWDYWKLKFPLIGQMLRKVYVLRFVSLLGILIEAGLPVIKALQITGNAIPNRIYKLKVQEVINGVKVGGKISNSMMDSEFLFPSEITEMIAVGEASASLTKVSEKVSSQYQREIDNSIKKLTSVFEPVMILFVGLSVALLALAIMAPIFNLSTSLGV